MEDDRASRVTIRRCHRPGHHPPAKVGDTKTGVISRLSPTPSGVTNHFQYIHVRKGGSGGDMHFYMRRIVLEVGDTEDGGTPP